VIAGYVIVQCERYAGIGRSTCSLQPLHLDYAPGDSAGLARIAGEAEREGYVADDAGRHWCPYHAPEQTGFMVRIGRDYLEIAPGVSVRMDSAYVDVVEIEVKIVRHQGGSA
jgi:hypothetical protein